MSSQPSLPSERIFKKSLQERMFKRGMIPTNKLILFAIHLVIFVSVYFALVKGLPSLTYDRLLALANPALLGTLSLLIGLLARNASISDRIRVLGNEVNKARVDKATPSLVKERFDSVENQLFNFQTRYVLNVVSLMMIAANLVLLPSIAITFPSASIPTMQNAPAGLSGEAPGNTVVAAEPLIRRDLPILSDQVLSNLTFRILFASSFLFVSAAVLCVLDIGLSIVTIEEDLKHSIETIQAFRKEDDEIDEEDTGVVVHFSLLFHKIWYPTRLEAIANQQDVDTQTRKFNDFLCTYFGLLQQQLHYFQNGLLPKMLYKQWLSFFREHAFDFTVNATSPPQRPIGDTTFPLWWQNNRAQFVNEDFQIMIDKLLMIKLMNDANQSTSEPARAYSIDEIVEAIKINGKKG